MVYSRSLMTGSDRPQKRIVSLIASATETVAALGHADALVGISHECDYPPEIGDRPRCTEPKFNVDGLSYEIDERIKAVLQEGLSVYRVFADTLEALRPDLILTQSQCEVCAVSLRDVEEAVCATIASRPQIVSLEPNCLDDVWRDIETIANAIGDSDAGPRLVQRLRTRIASVAEIARRLSDTPRVACIEWIDPLMAAGNWMPELVEMAGGENLFGEAGKHSPWMEFDALVEADPDVVVVLPCGWDKRRARAEMPPLTSRPAWHRLRAVREGRVYLTDGNQYFNRPGPRLAESLEILAEMFHPAAFNFGHGGIAWERL